MRSGRTGRRRTTRQWRHRLAAADPRIARSPGRRGRNTGHRRRKEMCRVDRRSGAAHWGCKPGAASRCIGARRERIAGRFRRRSARCTGRRRLSSAPCYRSSAAASRCIESRRAGRHPPRPRRLQRARRLARRPPARRALNHPADRCPLRERDCFPRIRRPRSRRIPPRRPYARPGDWPPLRNLKISSFRVPTTRPARASSFSTIFYRSCQLRQERRRRCHFLLSKSRDASGQRLAAVQRSIHPSTSSCQSLDSRGASTQWFSFGK